MQTPQAMIFAAGLGTRLKPITDRMPKALVPVGGQPLLWHVIQKLRAAGFGRIVINVHHFADQIIDYLTANDNFGLDIRISDERAALLDTGGGIKHALELFDPSMPILIHNVDILSNVNLQDLYLTMPQLQADALLLVSQRQTQRYLLFDDDRLCGWTNIATGELKGPVANDPSSMALGQLKKLAFSGIHVLSPGIFPLFQEMPDRFSIIDFYLQHCAHYLFRGVEYHDLQMLDVGKLDTLEQAEAWVNQ